MKKKYLLIIMVLIVACTSSVEAQTPDGKYKKMEGQVVIKGFPWKKHYYKNLRWQTFKFYKSGRFDASSIWFGHVVGEWKKISKKRVHVKLDKRYAEEYYNSGHPKAKIKYDSYYMDVYLLGKGKIGGYIRGRFKITNDWGARKTVKIRGRFEGKRCCRK